MKLKVAGINFDHMHMGDLLRMVAEHPAAEIVGVCDAIPARMEPVVRKFSLPSDRVFTRVEQCMEAAKPDLVVLCPATGHHADYVEQLAPYRANILVEKPFASCVGDADRMIAAARKHKIMLAINWPLRWSPSHCTAYRLLAEDRIGSLEEVHYYGGNRGPLWHTADKVETTPTPALKRRSWFYSHAKGGGSLLDYLGYGTTLGTWFQRGRKPIEITAVTDLPNGLEVDEHSITVARYGYGLSIFQTRWGTITDPWKHQPQPKCGFVLKGTHGSISSYDYEPTVRIQTDHKPEGEEIPVDELEAPYQNPIQYMIHCIRHHRAPEGPLSTRISRIGQQIVDSAILSAAKRKSVHLVS